MTSKEALNTICLECQRSKGKIQVACPFRSISNEYCDEYEQIKKDLEILEILKSYFTSIEKDLEILEILKYRIHLKEDTIKNDTKDYDIAWVEASGFVFKNSEEYKLLKEWLENGIYKVQRSNGSTLNLF